MSGRLLYALLSTSVVTAASWGLTTAAADHIPEGVSRRLAEKYALAPGRVLLEKLEDEGSLRRLRKEGKKAAKEGKKSLDRAADKIEDALSEYELKGAGKISKRAKRLTKAYNIGSWAVVGFALSLLLTAVLGVSTAKAALSLGFKVTLLMFFAQAALVFAGVLAVAGLAGRSPAVPGYVGAMKTPGLAA